MMRPRQQSLDVCAHLRAQGDNHFACFSCCGCSPNDPCEVSSLWDRSLWARVLAWRSNASRQGKSEKSSSGEFSGFSSHEDSHSSVSVSRSSGSSSSSSGGSSGRRSSASPRRRRGSSRRSRSRGRSRTRHSPPPRVDQGPALMELASALAQGHPAQEAPVPDPPSAFGPEVTGLPDPQAVSVGADQSLDRDDRPSDTKANQQRISDLPVLPALVTLGDMTGPSSQGSLTGTSRTGLCSTAMPGRSRQSQTMTSEVMPGQSSRDQATGQSSRDQATGQSRRDQATGQSRRDHATGQSRRTGQSREDQATGQSNQVPVMTSHSGHLDLNPSRHYSREGRSRDRRLRSRRSRRHKSRRSRRDRSPERREPNPRNMFPFGFPWGYGGFPSYPESWDPRDRSRSARRHKDKAVSPPQSGERPVLSLEDPFPQTRPVQKEGNSTSVARQPGSPRSQRPDDVLSIMAPTDDPIILECQRQPAAASTAGHHSPAHSPSVGTVDTNLEPGEQEEEPPQRFSLSAAFQVVYATLPPTVCPPPPVPKPSVGLSATDVMLQEQFPEQVGTKAPPLTLPVSPVVKEALNRVNEASRVCTSQPWSVSNKTFKVLHPSSCYRPPTTDPALDIGLEQAAPLPVEANRAGLSKVPPSSLVGIPFSTLESWELRDKRVLGLSSQVDFLAATSVKLVESLDSSAAEDLRQVVVALARSAKNLAANSAANMAEIVRFRRDATLQTSTSLLDSSKAALLSAPVESRDLFGHLLPQVLVKDKDDHLHASAVARSASGQRSRTRRPGRSPSSSSAQSKGRPGDKKQQFKSLKPKTPFKGSAGRGQSSNPAGKQTGISNKRSGPPRSGPKGQP